MKRHPSLEPFSRDHNTSLILARRLQTRPGPEVAAEFLHAWRVEFDDHFREEERLLGPLIEEEWRARLMEDHRRIREAAGRLGDAQTPDEMIPLGEDLERHVRWEERALFPHIEETLDEVQLEELGRQTAVMEHRHAASGLAPRRAELMRRRRTGL